MPAIKRWEVVGGGDKGGALFRTVRQTLGGILVREGQSTSSKQLADRLSTGRHLSKRF